MTTFNCVKCFYNLEVLTVKAFLFSKDIVKTVLRVLVSIIIWVWLVLEARVFCFHLKIKLLNALTLWLNPWRLIIPPLKAPATLIIDVKELISLKTLVNNYHNGEN